MPNHSLKLLGAALKKSSIDESFAFSRSIAKDFHSLLNKDVLKSTLGLEGLFKIESKNFPENLHAVERSMRLIVNLFYVMIIYKKLTWQVWLIL